MRKGALKIVAGSDPAAGVEISETVTAAKYWKLLAVKFTLVTDATVANREVDLILDDGANEFCRIAPTVVQTASLTLHYSWAIGLQQNSFLPLTASPKIAPLPDIVLGPGFRVRTTTQGIVAGDNFSAPVLYVVQFDGPPDLD